MTGFRFNFGRINILVKNSRDTLEHVAAAPRPKIIKGISGRAGNPIADGSRQIASRDSSQFQEVI